MSESEQDFPGFSDDSDRPPAKKKPPSPPSSSSDPGAFDPFADEEVEIDPTTGLPSTPGPAPASDPATPSQEAEDDREMVLRPPEERQAPPPEADEGGFDAFGDEEVDVQADAALEEGPPGKAGKGPGRRRDLWKCPHCGAGNKPERDECRSCGKRPSDPKEKPWFLNPIVVGTIGGTLTVIVLLFVYLGGPNFDLAPPTADHIDDQVRKDGRGGKKRPSRVGTEFQARGRFAVCGRVLSFQKKPGEGRGPTITLVLGPKARDLVEVNKLSVDPAQGVVIQSTLGKVAVPHCKLELVNRFDVVEKITPKGVFSMAGEWGVVIDGPESKPQTHHYMVYIANLEIGTPQ